MGYLRFLLILVLAVMLIRKRKTISFALLGLLAYLIEALQHAAGKSSDSAQTDCC